MKKISILIALMILTSVFLTACGGETEASPTLTVTSESEAEIISGGTYLLSYEVNEAAGGVTVDVTKNGGGGDGIFDTAASTFTATQTGVYILSVSAKNITKTTVKTVRITVSSVPPQVLSQEDFLERVSGSPYSANIATNTSMGLSDSASVGVNEEKFLNEIRYPVPKDSDFSAIYNAADYGILPENSDNKNALTALLSQVKETQGLKKIFFPSGIYKFGSAVSLKEINDLYLVGQGTEWLMTEWISILNFSECKNIHINNIDFDYQTSPTVSGTVVSSDTSAKTVTIAVDSEFDMTDYRYGGGKVNKGNYMEYVYDDSTARYIPDRNGMLRYNSTGDSQLMLTNGTYNASSKELTITFSTAITPPETGKKVSVGYTMYEHSGIFVEKCEGFYVETGNIYTVPGMVVKAHSSKDLYFNRFNMALREGTARLMTATADGLHTIDCYGDLIVSNSLFENSHDDAMNFCTFYFKVNSFRNKELTCTATTVEAPLNIGVGDTVEVLDINSMKTLYSRTVMEVKKFGTFFELVLDRSIPSMPDISGYLVANASRVSRLSLDNCIIRNKRNRGILAQVRDSEIINCTFQNIIHGAVSIVSAKDVFSEGVVPRNVSVKNCKFLNNSSDDVSAFRSGGTYVPDTITGIEVSNNFFGNCGGSSVFFRATGSSVIKNNLFLNGAHYLGQTSRAAVRLSFANNTTVTNNFVYRETALTGFTFLKQSDSQLTTDESNTLYNK